MRRNAAAMSNLVTQYREGDTKIHTFCDQHQINIHTFRYWLSKIKPTSTGNFIPLQPNRGLSNIQSATQQVTLTFPNGVVVCTVAQNLSLITALIRSI